MSAKHILNTNSTLLSFNDEFNEYLSLREGFRVIINEDIENVHNICIQINVNSINKYKDIDDLPLNEYVDEFFIYNKETKERIVIREESGASFCIADQLFDRMVEMRRTKKYDEDGFMTFPYIGPQDLSSDRDVFFIRLQNDEITKPLEELKGLVEKGKLVDAENVSEFIKELRFLMLCGGIKVDSVHIEVLARNLIRDIDNPTALPDWSKDEVAYNITSIHNAIMKNPSVLTSLTFERLKEQLKDPLTYTKSSTSFVDRLFILD